MASITIRQLDDDLKKRLRLRAASHGRSMEDEVRTILRGAAGTEAAPPGDRVRPPAKRAQEPAIAGNSSAVARNGHVLLVIGGGIAAYKSLDLIRRLRERGA